MLRHLEYCFYSATATTVQHFFTLVQHYSHISTTTVEHYSSGIRLIQYCSATTTTSTEYHLCCKTWVVPPQLHDYYSAVTPLVQYYYWRSPVPTYHQCSTRVLLLQYGCCNIVLGLLQWHHYGTTVLQYDNNAAILLHWSIPTTVQ
eukprot:3886647-Pyramimonas_sp.AAC.2